MNTVMDSGEFSEWVKSKNFALVQDMVADVIEKRLAAGDPNFVGKNQEDLEIEARIEITSNFIGEKCFGGPKSLDGLLKALQPEQRKNFIQRFLDFLRSIRDRIAGNKTLEDDITRIEKQFVKAYRAVEVSRQNNKGDNGKRYAIAGPKSNTANRSQMFDAILAVSRGEDAEEVRKRTGWYKGPDNKWRYYISDRELKIDGLLVLSNTPGTVSKLGNTIKHDKLFAAYPQLRDVKVSFDDIGEGKKGKFVLSNNEIVLHSKFKGDAKKIKDTLVHEVQHAIQHIEGFGTGGNVKIGFIYAFNTAYQEVQNTKEYLDLKNADDKSVYIFSNAEKLFGAKGVKGVGNKAYQKIYGETEARDVTSKRHLSDNLLINEKPDMTGIVFDYAAENEKFVANLKEIGYTEEKIEQILGGVQFDESGSNENIEKRTRGNIHGDGWWRDIAVSNIGDADADEQGRRESGDLGRGVYTEIPGRMGRGEDLINSIEAERNDSAFSMSETERRYSITPETQLDLFEKYKSGEITEDEYRRIISSEKVLNPNEIANLTEKDANTTPKLEKQKGTNKGNKVSNVYGSLLGSSIFDDAFREEITDDTYIRNYQSITNRETLAKAARELDEGGEAYVMRWSKKLK